MILTAPQYFVERLGATPTRAGELLAICSSVNLPGTLLTGVVEQWMASRGMTLLRIRRLMSGSAALICSVSAIFYALATTPLQGTITFFSYTVGHCFHESGIFPFFLELGGPDAALLSSFCNSTANIPGVLVPVVVLFLRKLTGSWLPHFAMAAGLQLISAAWWVRSSSVRPARELLALQRGPRIRPPANADPGVDEAMEFRVLGKTGFRVSAVSMGCWQIGGAYSGADATASHKQALNAFLDQGGNFLDTANVYGGDYGTDRFGWSESTIRLVLAERKAAGKDAGRRIFIATKAGRAPPGGYDHGPDRYTYESLSASVRASAERLAVNRIDLLQLHCPPTSVLRGTVAFEALRRLKREGRIEHWGVSVETVEEAYLAIRQPDCATVQVNTTAWDLCHWVGSQTVCGCCVADHLQHAQAQAGDFRVPRCRQGR